PLKYDLPNRQIPANFIRTIHFRLKVSLGRTAMGLRIYFGSLVVLAGLAGFGPGLRAAHCGVTLFHRQGCCPAQTCFPQVKYRICYQCVVKETQCTVLRPVYHTVMKQCKHTVYEPVYQHKVREVRSIVNKKVWENYNVVHKYTVMKPVYEHCIQEH